MESDNTEVEKLYKNGFWPFITKYIWFICHVLGLFTSLSGHNEFEISAFLELMSELESESRNDIFIARYTEVFSVWSLTKHFYTSFGFTSYFTNTIFNEMFCSQFLLLKKSSL
jgi:hypothetical protein